MPIQFEYACDCREKVRAILIDPDQNDINNVVIPKIMTSCFNCGKRINPMYKLVE